MLKKVLLAICIVILAQVSFAGEGPFSKGSVQLGGSLSFSTQGGDAYRDNTQLMLSPSFCYFMGDNFCAGGFLALQYYNVNEGIYDYSNTDWLVGGTVGYYITNTTDGLNFKSKVVPYFSGLLGFSNQDSITQLKFGGAVGFDYMVSNAVGINLSMNFIIDRFSSNGDSITGHTILFGVGVDSFIF